MLIRACVHARTTLCQLLLVGAIIVAVAPAARAWHAEGHLYSTVAATESLPADVPAFFREGAIALGQIAIDPDVHRERELPPLFSAEAPEHYFDVEYLEGRAVPETRYQFLHLCEQMDLNPYRVGLGPYAVTEWTQRLTLAFAEYRARPDDEHVRAKCMVYAGLLAHYAADLQMPLHTSIHYDGRVGEDGESPRSGIHEKIDALPTMIAYNELFAWGLPEPTRAFEPGGALAHVVDRLMQSHALVDAVYELEDELPAPGEPIESEAVRDFTIGRMRGAATHIAELYYSAWVNSAHVDLPPWLDREAFEGRFDRDATPSR